MFFVIVCTPTYHIFNDFAPASTNQNHIFRCHTVRNGTDLRKSPHIGCTYYVPVHLYTAYSKEELLGRKRLIGARKVHCLGFPIFWRGFRGHEKTTNFLKEKSCFLLFLALVPTSCKK